MSQVRKYYAGPVEVFGDVRMGSRYFTCRSSAGLIAGCDFNVNFRLDAPVSEVWPYVKDFNLWQNAADHYYSGVVGDLEGKTFRISLSPDDQGPHQYRVLKVIPEYLIVAFQPIPSGGAEEVYLPGLGGISPGFHVVTLVEYGETTDVTFLMEHASLMEESTDIQKMSEEEALRPWRDPGMVPEWLRKWREGFIPKLRELVSERIASKD